MTMKEAAQELGLSETDIARECESINPEEFATREAFIEAHPEPRRSELYAEWAEEDAANEAESRLDEYRENRRENG